ncbi:protein of unknown function (plasmid) [Cupriavidus taiwanensis]|uniref:SIS domain-containing protein n=1 Tax=Cupriavidus taiwanensis TaxID=164546 RepID=A0A375IAZ6_9BURK|nr:hypothetical protein [Cupriavidus taiwanensis]SPK70542.1 hypothetical protein CT19425_U600036 [Cupriavidus taiwanensis]SPK77085.1 protein of unknown function [Cupriavidus taiwanensis]
MCAVAHANRVGAKGVILTDPSATDLPARSDVVLRCVNHGAAVFDSYVAAVSLINHLCTSLALILGDAARERLEEIESLHDHYGDLQPLARICRRRAPSLHNRRDYRRSVGVFHSQSFANEHDVLDLKVRGFGLRPRYAQSAIISLPVMMNPSNCASLI